jgi:hypothetical protein
MPVPDFSPGEVLTAAAMDSIGLWLVKTQTIGTAVASVTVSNAFSADYDNYKIIMTGGIASTAGALGFQISGVTTGVYFGGSVTANYINGAYIGDFMNGSTSWTVAGFHNSSIALMSLELMNPFATQRKWMFSYPIIAGGNGFGSTVGECTDANSRTGFVITPQSGTLTDGTIRVYGYRK